MFSRRSLAWLPWPEADSREASASAEWERRFFSDSGRPRWCHRSVHFPGLVVQQIGRMICTMTRQSLFVHSLLFVWQSLFDKDQFHTSGVVTHLFQKVWHLRHICARVNWCSYRLEYSFTLYSNTMYNCTSYLSVHLQMTLRLSAPYLWLQFA